MAASRALDALEGHLDGREWLVGDAFSIADISLYAYTHLARRATSTSSAYPAVRGLDRPVAAAPGHVPIEA